jgi:nucleoid-associated protein YgaU
MKQFEITDVPEIAKENFANLFNVYARNVDDLTYSINKGLYFENTENLSPNSFSFYTIRERDQWSTISYRFYNTIELWWLICKVNQITDPVENSPKAGTKIKILNKTLVPSILQQIRTM